jgi:hypothetical protein
MRSVVDRNVMRRIPVLADTILPSYYVTVSWAIAVAYPGIFSGGSTNSVEDRERGSGGGSPIVRGSGGSCNLVQQISFHIVNFS